MNSLGLLGACVGAYLWVGWPGVAIAFGASFIEYLTGRANR